MGLRQVCAGVLQQQQQQQQRSTASRYSSFGVAALEAPQRCPIHEAAKAG
jgi:hypothetical protein